MTEPYATLQGEPVASAHVHIPGFGVWFADVDMLEAPALSGRVTLRLGALELHGTVDPRYAGTFAERARVRVVGGANGWANLLASKSYHNDAGVRALTVATDAAREAGESLGTFSPQAERVGVDYVQTAGPASRVLEDVIGDQRWYVDYLGVTHVGARAEVTADGNAYEVLEANPMENVVTLAVDDLRAIAIGSIITSLRLDVPLTVREIGIEVTEANARVKVWGGAAAATQRIGRALRAIIARSTDDRVFGLSRYRVINMSGDRVELQAVDRSAGLPDIQPISMWPGVAGAHALLSPGAEVLVQFIEGDRAQPIVTHFAGKDGNGFVPVNVLIDATGLITLGDGATSFVALADKIATELAAIKTGIEAGGGSYTPNPAGVGAAKVRAL